MAKLSANGYEIARLRASLKRPDDPAFCETVFVISFRSNGHILKSHKARRSYSDPYQPGKLEDFGWKRWKRFKPEVRQDAARLQDAAVSQCKRYADDFRSRGWEVS